MVKVDPEEMNERRHSEGKKLGWGERERIGTEREVRKEPYRSLAVAERLRRREGKKKRARLLRSFSGVGQKKCPIASNIQAGWFRSGP